MNFPIADYIIETLSKLLDPILPVQPGSKTFSTVGSHTFTVPEKVTKIRVEAHSATGGGGGGGGAGGGGCSYQASGTCYNGGGGGGGGPSGPGCVVICEISVTPGQVIPVVIGKGGNGGSGGRGGTRDNNQNNTAKDGSMGTQGQDAGQTSFGNYISFNVTGSGGMPGGAGGRAFYTGTAWTIGFRGNGGAAGKAITPNVSNGAITLSVNGMTQTDLDTIANSTAGKVGTESNSCKYVNGYYQCSNSDYLVPGGAGGLNAGNFVTNLQVPGVNGGNGGATGCCVDGQSGNSGAYGTNGKIIVSWG